MDDGASWQKLPVGWPATQPSAPAVSDIKPAPELLNVQDGAVCPAVNVLPWAKFNDATTAPVVGEIVSELSLFDTELTAPVIVFHEQAEIFPLAVPHSKACVPLGPVAGSWYQFAVKLAEFGPTQPAVFAVGVSVAVLPGRTTTPGYDPLDPAEIDPGAARANVLGLMVKPATVLSPCCPEVADPANIE